MADCYAVSDASGTMIPAYVEQRRNRPPGLTSTRLSFMWWCFLHARLNVKEIEKAIIYMLYY